MRLYFLICCFFVCSVIAQDDLNVQSDAAIYDDQGITLTGNVAIEHLLGLIQANYMYFVPAKDQKRQYTALQMKGDILISSKEGARLACQEAELKYTSLKGSFLGNVEQPDVVYTSAPSLGIPFVIKSEEMQVHLQQEDKTSITLQDIEAHRHVRANYQNSLITAARAHYIYDLTSKQSFLNLYAAPGEMCQIIDAQQQNLQATCVKIDIKRQQMDASNPKGYLQLPYASSIVTCSAEELTWDYTTHLLTLKKNIHLEHAELGSIHTEHMMQLQQQKLDGKLAVQSIVSAKDTFITYQDKYQLLCHTLHCPGPLQIDHQKKQLILQRSASDQVYFEDMTGEMYANRVLIDYEEGVNNLQPTKVVLEGQVQILSRFDGHLQGSDAILRYALAERVEYYPERLEMICYGCKNQRVLLFDKINQLQMSAPAITIHWDDKTQRESIRGMGDVRFRFVEQELTRVKDYFQHS